MINRTFSMQATTAFTIAFTDPALTRLKVTAKAECYVQPVLNSGTATAPGASPAPSGGASADYIHLLAGESTDFDLSAGFSPNSAKSAAPSTDRITALRGYGVGAGDLLMVGV